MKKSFGLTALAACVLLSGCSFDFSKLAFWKKDTSEDQQSDDNGNQDTPPVVEKTISIESLPKTVVGSPLDLEEYVKCEGGSGDFTIEISEESASFAGLDLSGKKIIAEHSGEVKFTVKYEGVTKEATASFVSEEYVSFLEATKNIGYNYGIYGTDEDGYISSYTNFGSNYYYDVYGNEGMVELDGEVYTFGLYGESLEDLEVFYSLTGYEPESLEGYTSPFFINEDILKCEYYPAEDENPAYEAICIDDHDAVVKICEIYFGYSAQAIERVYKLHSVEIFEDALTDNAGNVYPVYDLILNIEVPEDGGIGIYYLAWNFIDISEDANEFTFLDEMFKTEVPHGMDASGYFAVIDSVIDSHNFSVEYSAGWIEYTEEGMYQLDGNPFLTEETEEIGNYINHYLLANETLIAYVTETQTYIENGDAAYSEGLVAHEGHVYTYGGEEEAALISATASSIFDDELKGEVHNYLFLKTDNGDSILENAFVNEVFDDEYGSGFTIGGSAVADLFSALFYFAVPVPEQMKEYKDCESDYEYILQYADLFYTAAFLYEENCAKYLLCEVDFIYEAENLVGIDFSFAWEDEGEDGEAYYYCMDAYLYDFGVTEIPAEVVVNYPEE